MLLQKLQHILVSGFVQIHRFKDNMQDNRLYYRKKREIAEQKLEKKKTTGVFIRNVRAFDIKYHW